MALAKIASLRYLLAATLLFFLLLGVPIHLVRLSQLSINCDVKGRGVLQLTAQEQNFFMLDGVAMLLQVVIVLELTDFGHSGCMVISYFITNSSAISTLYGTAIALCR